MSIFYYQESSSIIVASKDTQIGDYIAEIDSTVTSLLESEGQVSRFEVVSGVVVAIEHCYEDNNGAYSVAHILHNDTLTTLNYANAYNKRSFDDLGVNASPEQIKKSVEIYKEKCIDTGRNNSYIGCTVILSRSRKAPNKTPLKVVSNSPRYYDNQFHTYVDEKILVDVDGELIWVNASCVKTVVTGKPPFWA